MDTSENIIKVARKICHLEKLELDEEKQNSGTFKKVFKVISRDGKPFALKVFKSEIRSQRTLREIQAIQKCDHNSIAKIKKFSSIEFNALTYDFIIEEYLGGGSLTDLLKEKKTLNIDESIKLGSKLIISLEHMYMKNLVHRDIKPDNIMFRDGTIEPVLVDFSIVRDLCETSITQSWLGRGPGTPLFASPEQLNNQKRLIDWRTDQFSLGIVLSLTIFDFHPYQTNSDSMISNDTVENITLRKRNSEFLRICKQNGLDCLSKMTKPWPVERYRLPKHLINSWNNLE